MNRLARRLKFDNNNHRLAQESVEQAVYRDRIIDNTRQKFAQEKGFKNYNEQQGSEASELIYYRDKKLAQLNDEYARSKDFKNYNHQQGAEAAEQMCYRDKAIIDLKLKRNPRDYIKQFIASTADHLVEGAAQEAGRAIISYTYRSFLEYWYADIIQINQLSQQLDESLKTIDIQSKNQNTILKELKDSHAVLKQALHDQQLDNLVGLIRKATKKELLKKEEDKNIAHLNTQLKADIQYWIQDQNRKQVSTKSSISVAQKAEIKIIALEQSQKIEKVCKEKLHNNYQKIGFVTQDPSLQKISHWYYQEIKAATPNDDIKVKLATLKLEEKVENALLKIFIKEYGKKPVNTKDIIHESLEAKVVNHIEKIKLLCTDGLEKNSPAITVKYEEPGLQAIVQDYYTKLFKATQFNRDLLLMAQMYNTEEITLAIQFIGLENKLVEMACKNTETLFSRDGLTHRSIHEAKQIGNQALQQRQYLMQEKQKKEALKNPLNETSLQQDEDIKELSVEEKELLAAMEAEMNENETH